MKRISTCISCFIAVAMGLLSYLPAQAAEETPQAITVEDICVAMYSQYPQFYEYNWFNGEPWLSMVYGEVVGQDYISLFWMSGYPTVPNWEDMTDKDSQCAKIAWDYCYNLILMANSVISSTENNSTDKEAAFICAQGLTFRAHAYLRLLQIYGPRWEDRFDTSGGETPAVPIILTSSVDNLNDVPSASMSVVLAQIYDDLSRAIELYNASGLKRTQLYEPDIAVCKGIYARAAMLKHDWFTASKMAQEARQDYPLMTGQEYLAGFAEPTGEWIWCDTGRVENVYYASFAGTYGCNGPYPCLWGSIGAGAIDFRLQSMANLYDLRSRLFFSPITTLARKEYFWGAGCDATTLNINLSTSPLHTEFVSFAEYQYQRVAESNGWLPPYTYQGYSMGTNNTVCVAQFGAQFKFWGTDQYGTSKFPFMRASEMLLIEAEASWQIGNEAKARELMDELNLMRFNTRSNGSSYYKALTSSGEELLNDIKMYRRLELWGEGFSWFDYKRWNQPIERIEWKSGATTVDGGNWPKAIAGTFPTDYANGWRWSIPANREPINAVEEIPAEGSKPLDIFMLNGVCVKKNATEGDIKALKPGFYIIGGKKVIIK